MISFREATTEDAALIAVLNADVQAIHAAGLPDLFKTPVMSDQLVEEFKTKLQKRENVFLIAVADGEPAGYLFAEIQHQQPTPRHKGSKRIYVHHISVSAAFRRQGIGRDLLDHARAIAVSRGIEKMALDVWRFNEDARKFFADYGLEVYNENLWMKVS